jgi:hypothetical protein
VTALAEQAAYSDTRLLDECGLHFSPSLRDLVVVEDAEPTAGLTYREIGPQGFLGWRFARGWTGLAEQAKLVVVARPRDLVELEGSGDNQFTVSFSAPALETRIGTGHLFQDVRDWVRPIRRNVALILPSATVDVSAPLVLDFPEALREARTQAGLPVQDLAAMFGIKRRQFYNLMSGEDAPDPAREGRIGLVTDAIHEISQLVAGNSRKARAVLLARLDGDSVYDAAVADDEGRLAVALERALAASGDAVAQHRLAPSRRAKPEEAAAVRDFLRATRDETGGSDPDSA